LTEEISFDFEVTEVVQELEDEDPSPALPKGWGI